MKFDATRCQILMLKCTKFDFRWGVYSVPPNLLAVFKGPILRGGWRKGRKGEGGKGTEECGGERSEPRTAVDHDCHPTQHRQVVKVTWHKAVSPSSTDRSENCICPVVSMNTSSNKLAQIVCPRTVSRSAQPFLQGFQVCPTHTDEPRNVRHA